MGGQDNPGINGQLISGMVGAITPESSPLHPELSAVLGAWPKTHAALLTTNFGKPFSPKGFGNWMADRISDASLGEQCVTHGLRKAAARRLAEAGCSANEIAAITGHTTLKEVGRYTKAAEQRTLATAAIERLTKQKPNKNSQPQSEFGKNPEKISESSDD
jgi:integrase